MSRGRGLALGAVALALGLLIATLLLRRAERGEPVRVGADPLAGARADPDPGGAEPVRASSARQPGVDARVALESRASEAGVGEGIRVRVVRAADRTPVPGAEVLYFDSGSVDPLAYLEFVASPESGLEEKVVRFGRSFRADRTGMAVVPFPRAAGSVGVAHEGAWAQEPIEPLTEEVELELQPDRALGVRLLDADRAAVPGAVVELRRRLSDGSYLAHAQQRTDEHGRARLKHLQWMRPEAEGIALEYFVGAVLLAAEPVQVAIDPAHWPSEELVLELPGTGALVVEPISPGGEPWHGDGQVEIGLARATLARIRAAGGDIPVTSSLRAIRAGRATFERLGLELELELFVNPDGWKQHLATVSGPTRAGETVTAPVRLSEPAPSIRGRIVDREGRPLARESLSCELWSQREPQHQVEHRRSDDSGRFAGFGGPYLLDDGAWSLFFFVRGEPQRAATVTLAAPAAAGPIELGDVVLDLPPRLASGIVADESGWPVRAATLLFQEETDVPWQPGALAWIPLPRGAVASASDGSFELRGWTRSEHLKLSVHRPGYERVEPLELDPPAEGLRIVLRNEGAIAGRILTARGRVQGMVDLSVHDERSASHGGAITWGADGAFRVGGLRSGSYTLQLRQWSHYPGFRAWPMIAVRSGETTDIGTIDLDEIVRVLRFDVRDESGAPIAGALFGWPRPGAERLLAFVLEKDASGDHLLPTLELPLSLVQVTAPGFLPARLEDVSADQRVVLERGPRVQLVLSGLPALDEHWSMWARLVQDEVWEAPAVFDATGRTSLDLGSHGRFHVTLDLQHRGETRFRGTRGLGWQIEVADSKEEQTFLSPAPTPEFLDSLARHMRRER